MAQAQIGLVGLGVMGQSLALNINDHGFKLAVFNRERDLKEGFFQDKAGDTDILATYSMEELVEGMLSPVGDETRIPSFRITILLLPKTPRTTA